MSLTCSCYEYDGDGWYWTNPTEGTYMPKRGKKCCSCGDMVRTGDTCVSFERYRAALSDIEDSIYGEEVPLADWVMCEKCGDLFWALDELGFCVYIGADSMRELTRQYAETYGPGKAA